MGRLRTTRPARFSKRFAASIRLLEMNPRSLASTVSGIRSLPKKGKARAAALTAHLSVVATPKLKAASVRACGLERLGNALLICSVQWYNAFGWLTVGALLLAGLIAINVERFRQRVNLFSCPH